MKHDYKIKESIQLNAEQEAELEKLRVDRLLICNKIELANAELNNQDKLIDSYMIQLKRIDDKKGKITKASEV